MLAAIGVAREARHLHGRGRKFGDALAQPRRDRRLPSRLHQAEPLARFIAVFDHYAHTRSLPNGVIAEGIQAAKTLVFCFGITLPDPQALALRPRSMGVCELDDRFVLTFAEAPMPVANLAMERWALSVVARQAE